MIIGYGDTKHTKKSPDPARYDTYHPTLNTREANQRLYILEASIYTRNAVKKPTMESIR